MGFAVADGQVHPFLQSDVFLPVIPAASCKDFPVDFHLGAQPDGAPVLATNYIAIAVVGIVA